MSAPRASFIDVIDRVLEGVGTIPGVRLQEAAARNGPGTGAIRSTSRNVLQWRAPGSTAYGLPVVTAGDGNYVLGDGDDRDKWVKVGVVDSWLQPGTAEARVFLRDVYNNGTGRADVDLTGGGSEDVDSVTLVNESDRTLRRVTAWLNVVLVGFLEISAAAGGPFSAPTTAPGITLTDVWAPSQPLLVHIKRKWSAPFNGPAVKVTNVIRVRAYGSW